MIARNAFFARRHAGGMHDREIQGRERAGAYGRDGYHGFGGYFEIPSTFAARTKSLSVSPSILCVQITTRTRPQER